MTRIHWSLLVCQPNAVLPNNTYTACDVAIIVTNRCRYDLQHDVLLSVAFAINLAVTCLCACSSAYRNLDLISLECCHRWYLTSTMSRMRCVGHVNAHVLPTAIFTKPALMETAGRALSWTGDFPATESTLRSANHETTTARDHAGKSNCRYWDGTNRKCHSVVPES
jgi:hypothetical protein